ncbi:MAG: TatD family hydrolase [Actinomycetia bacterium]|nr:TatD family hydrolase [Actinomycetes bacterium]
MRLVDSHGHLQDPAFDADRDLVWQRAVAAGVGVVIPGYSEASSRDAVALAERWPTAWAAVGIHPHEAGEWSETCRRAIAEWARHPRVVAIGEIGLDYYRDLSPRPLQRAVFLEQLALARAAGLPVSVHSRDAEEDTLGCLGEVPEVAGVLHCFTGSERMARRLLDRGFYLSFAGPLTFRNGQHLRDIARWVPLDRVLVETDAPYMAPVPYRGRRNEPAWVVHTARVLAQVKNLPEKEVFDQIVANTHALFFRVGRTATAGGGD